MTTNSLRSPVVIWLAICLAASPGFGGAAAPAIGTAITPGAFRLNHATVRSNATLFEGALVETGGTPSRMDLTSGTRLELESESAGRVFGRHLALERGAARIDAAAGPAVGFRVETRGLTIQPDASASTGRIVLIGARRVEVAALTGSFRVLNPEGVLVAKIAAGRALALEPQSIPSAARITGRLLRRGDHYLLTDETTNVTVEVAGSAFTKPDLTKGLGQRVEVTGSVDSGAAPVSGAAQRIEVAQITQAPPTGSTPPASAPAGAGGAGGTAPAGAGGGGGAASGAAISVTMIAIIGGVAAAAVVGGLAAAGDLGGSTAAPISR